MQGQKGDRATLLDVYEAPLYDGAATNSKVIIFKVLCRPITPRMVIQVIGDRVIGNGEFQPSSSSRPRL